MVERELEGGIQVQDPREVPHRVGLLVAVECEIARQEQGLLVVGEGGEDLAVLLQRLPVPSLQVGRPGPDQGPLLGRDGVRRAQRLLDGLPIPLGRLDLGHARPGELEPRQREPGIDLHRPPELRHAGPRMEAGVAAGPVHAIHAEEVVLLGLQARGHRPSHRHRRGPHLRPRLSQPAAGLLREPVDEAGDAGLARPLLPEPEEVAVGAGVEGAQLQAVGALEAADGAEEERLDPRAAADVAGQRLVDAGGILAAELPEKVDHAGAREDREPARLLQGRDEHAREAVEIVLPGLVGEVGHRDQHALAGREGLAAAEQPSGDGGEGHRGRQRHQPAPEAAGQRGLHSQERGQDGAGALRPPAGRPGQAALDQRAQPPRQAPQGRRSRRDLVGVAAGAAPHRMGSPSGEHLVEQPAQGEEVRPRVLGLAPPLLRGHVGGGAARRRPLRAEEVGQAEVEHLHVSVGAEEDVPGLQVPVEDPRGVRVRQRAGDGHGDLHRLPGRQRSAPEPLGQALAAEPLQHQVGTAFPPSVVVEDHDVRV